MSKNVADHGICGHPHIAGTTMIAAEFTPRIVFPIIKAKTKLLSSFRGSVINLYLGAIVFS